MNPVFDWNNEFRFLHGLPLDPNDKYYLTNCYACQSVAKPDQEFIRNYGGVVCFSCRAFWRRAHQKQKGPEFQCKGGGGCFMTTIGKRKCQKCRLDLCKAAGMTKEAILTDEQKLIRFRKMIQKRRRKEEAIANATVEAPPSASLPSTSLPSTSLPSTSLPSTSIPSTSLPTSSTSVTCRPAERIAPLPSLETFVYDHLFRGVKRNVNGEIFNLEGNLPQKIFVSADICRETNDTRNKIFSQKLEKIVSGYRLTIGLVHEEICNEFLEVLQTAAEPVEFDDLLPQFIRCSQKLSRAVEEFASRLRAFKRISFEDRKRLLNRNLPLFVQMYLARCILLYDHRGDILNILTSKFSSGIVKFFKPGVDLTQYLHLIQKLEFLARLDSVELRGVVSYVTLFDFDDMSELRDLCEIQEVLIINEGLFEHCLLERVELTDVMSALVRLALFCNYNLAIKDRDFDQDPVGLALPYMEEEETWLRCQINYLETALGTLPEGNQFLQNFICRNLTADDCGKGQPEHSVFSQNLSTENIGVIGESFRGLLSENLLNTFMDTNNEKSENLPEEATNFNPTVQSDSMEALMVDPLLVKLKLLMKVTNVFEQSNPLLRYFSVGIFTCVNLESKTNA